MRNRSNRVVKGEKEPSTLNENNDNEDKFVSRTPRKLFADLHRQAIKLGLKPEDFQQLSSVNEIQKSINRVNYCRLGCRLFLTIACIVFVAILFIFVTEWPVSNTHVIVWWFQWYKSNPLKEPCVVYIPESVTENIKPPLNCDFCRNVHYVDHINNISIKEFESQYAYSGIPIVISDGTKNWTASEFFSYNFMKEVFSPGSEALDKVERDCQFFPYKTDFSSLGKVFEMSEERAFMKGEAMPWYIGWSNCDNSAANILRQHYTRPYFLPEFSESSKTDWIFMGSPGYGAHLHIDHVDLPSWQAQITGRKRWILQPPRDCYFQCPRQLEVIVNQGEIIVLDTNKWYHSTLNIGENISITIGSEYD